VAKTIRNPAIRVGEKLQRDDGNSAPRLQGFGQGNGENLAIGIESVHPLAPTAVRRKINPF
jgi:hypothetical protein